MERIREARRMTMAAAPNGLSRRRQHQQHQHHHHHRTNGLRDSPEDDGAVELQETGRLRDRGSGKRDRDPDRDRERERERERERDRDRDRDRDRLARSKRRRGDRMIHGSNREDGGDYSSDESINDDEDDEDEDGGGGAGGGTVRMLPPSQGFSSTSSLFNHRKSFPPPTKVSRPAPAWKAADEMIGVSVPRKARSASTKRSHDCWASSAGIVGEQFHRQTSTSPARTSGASAMGIGASQSPASHSSSNASVRKKIKPTNGAKLRPPKSCSKSSSSAQDEIEIEIAEVLYGMMRQPQVPTKQEIVAKESMKLDYREANNKTSCEAKSRVSSPISNSQSAPPLSSSIPPQNSGSSITAISAVAPKRKRPRPVKYDEESPSMFTACSSPISSVAKAESENQPSKIETSAPKLEKTTGSVPENCSVSCDAANSQSSEPHPEPVKLETAGLPESKTTGAAEPESRDSKDEAKSPKKDSSAQRKSDDNREVEVTKATPTFFEAESQRVEKFPIDLMAPPPPLRSSPERDGDIDFEALEPKPVVTDVEMVHAVKPVMKEEEKGVKVSKPETEAGESEMARIVAEETESQRAVLAHYKERNVDLQLDLEKADKDNGTGGVGSKKLSQNSQKRQQQQQQHPNPEKNAQTNSLPLPMSVPSWPGLPTMGYMSPLHGVVSMDGNTVSSAVIPPPHFFFNQPRPKRCATHCYIARNISYHQQISRMNPFWPAAAGSASLYATKPSNASVIPSTDPHNSITGRNATFTQEKGPSLAMFPGHFGKEKGPQAVNMVETAQRKQLLLQQPLPPGAPGNILHGPAFIFSLNQQQAAQASSVCPGVLKSSSNAGSVSSSTSCTAPVNASATGPATAPAMSFSYPNIPGNETQYLAILQNNAYPFPIPGHVGAPPAYRGTHPQALPFFNGSFYSSQIIHPSQLQPQQQQQQLPAQSQHSHQGRQTTSFSDGSTSSQKHLQNNQQQKPNGGGGHLQSFPPKNQSLQQQQRQPIRSHHTPHRAPQMESEMGSEENPAADGRFSRAAMSLYGQNFAIPMQPANFTLMTSTSVSGMNTPSTSSSEKKQQQQAVPKAGVETSQAFAIPYAPINGSTSAPAIDLSSIPQNHPILQSHGYQMMAAAAAAAVAQQKSYHASEEVKAINGDSSNVEDERKPMGGKIPSSIGQSIAFSRSDITNPSICAMPGNALIDSSARSLNLGSASGRPSGSVVHAAMNPVYAPTSQQQLPRNQQQQQIPQLQKNQQFAAVARSKIATSNGSVYSDHLPSTSSVTTKFTATASPYPQNLVQSGNPAQSTQWKNSGRAPTSQPTSPSLLSAPSSSAKALPQPQGRSQQTHMQISFAANSKSSTAPVLQPAASNQSQSPPIMVGSPTTSSMSKSAGGSPRRTSSSTSNKFSQASLSSQQVKNSQSIPSSKSSPVGGKNVPSILGSPHLTPTLNTATKSQVPQQQQQPHISKQALQQAQLFFSNAYLHAQTSQPSKKKDVPKN